MCAASRIRTGVIHTGVLLECPRSLQFFRNFLSARNQKKNAEESVTAPHLAHPEGCAALRIVLVAVPRISRSREHFPGGFDQRLLYFERHHGGP